MCRKRGLGSIGAGIGRRWEIPDVACWRSERRASCLAIKAGIDARPGYGARNYCTTPLKILGAARAARLSKRKAEAKISLSISGKARAESFANGRV